MIRISVFVLCFFCIEALLSGSLVWAQDTVATRDDCVRFATFNVALNRKKKGDLTAELRTGSKSASKLAAIIQTVRPDVLLLNEIDFDEGKSLREFEKYLAKPQHGQKAIEYSHRYVAQVNTGVDSEVDVDGDGRKGSPQDAFGYGVFPGQYGMAVLSRYPIPVDKIRTFQKFLWKDMPGALIPTNPGTKEAWYSPDVWKVFRLSSKSHWDLPIQTGSKTIHFLVSHPTPPVFDEEEDRNGKRNHDEIRIWADYASGKAGYLYDDKGTQGGLKDGEHFVIAGDLNADPHDGDSADNAINQLLKHPRIGSQPCPASAGGKFYAEKDGGANRNQKGDPSHDTSNFNDRTVGNMRVDYVLPSKSLTVKQSGVFWPVPDQPGSKLADVSDHRLVWIDIEK